MDVQRTINHDTLVEPLDQFGRVALGVAGGELAAGVAGAGDQPATQRRGAPIEPKRGDGCQRFVERRVWNVADQQVLPHGQAQRAGAEAFRDRGKSAHRVPGHAGLRHNDADVIEARLFLQDARRYGRACPAAAAAVPLPDRRAAAACRGIPPSPRESAARPSDRARISAAPWCGRCGRPRR